MNFIEKIIKHLSELQKISILLLASNNFEPIKGKLWFQKEMYLLSKNINLLEEESDFEPDLLGPNSETLDEELEELEDIKIVKEDENKRILTTLGQEIAKILISKTDKESLKIISDMKNFFNDMTKDEILGYVYFSFPEMTEESIEYKNILAKRKEIAISLFKKRKVSLGKASEIAGLPIEDFMKLLKSYNISLT
jgi:predicted HTH domain antitoxin